MFSLSFCLLLRLSGLRHFVLRAPNNGVGSTMKLDLNPLAVRCPELVVVRHKRVWQTLSSDEAPRAQHSRVDAPFFRETDSILCFCFLLLLFFFLFVCLILLFPLLISTSG
jgi:hypothetical protein